MKQLSLFLAFFTLLGCTAHSQNSVSLNTGDPAPLFSLPYATKDTIGRAPLNISDYIGKNAVVLAFYPADWSGGCTKEMCTMRDNFADLAKLHASVFGISGDYIFSHHEWAKYHQLPFTLLSDHSHEVAKKYLSYNETSGYNQRTVYVIDTSGKIAYIDRKYNPQDEKSFNELQGAISRLKQ